MNASLLTYAIEPELLRRRFGDREFPIAGVRILKDFRRMVRTGKMPISYATMLEPISIYEAGLRAQKTGKRVFIKDVK